MSLAYISVNLGLSSVSPRLSRCLACSKPPEVPQSTAYSGGETLKWCLAHWSRSQSPFWSTIKSNHNYALRCFVSSPVIYTNSFCDKDSWSRHFFLIKKSQEGFWTCQWCMALLQIGRENAFLSFLKITFNWIRSDFICMLWLILCTVKIDICCTKERENWQTVKRESSL